MSEAASPPRSAAYYWRWALGVLVIALIGLWIYQAYFRSKGTPPPPRPHLVGGGGSRVNGPFRVGDRIALGSYGVTVMGLTDPFQVQPGPLTEQPPAGKRYVLLRVSLSNLGSTPLQVSAATTVLVVDQHGHRYSAKLLVAGAPGPPPPASLGPHATQRGTLVFTLPDQARAVAALFEPGLNLALLATPMPSYGQVRIGLGGG